MTKYFITVLRYYVFDADSDDEALTKFNDESTLNLVNCQIMKNT